MKRILLLSVVIIGFALASHAQSTKYISYSGEMIFSFASIEDQGREESSLMRWAPVFNMQGMYNIDMNKQFGVFSGLAIRNVGYIYDTYTNPQTLSVNKKKFRTYNLAIPVGFKVGNLDKMFLFAGYELEFPFHYKEKTFDGGDKIDKITGWFSKRYEPIQHGFLAGVQFPGGPSLKFKYYLSEFHNQEYEDGSGNRPYAGLKSNIFYFSLNYYLFSKVDYSSL
jgi:hypothetical protein